MHCVKTIIHSSLWAWVDIKNLNPKSSPLTYKLKLTITIFCGCRIVCNNFPLKREKKRRNYITKEVWNAIIIKWEKMKKFHHLVSNKKKVKVNNETQFMKITSNRMSFRWLITFLTIFFSLQIKIPVRYTITHSIMGNTVKLLLIIGK